MTNHTPRLTRSLLLAAAAAVPLAGFAPDAAGQYRVENGRVNDANNRVGSGGYNDGGRVYNPGAFGNDVVNGNVTGGREFRGSVPYTDSRSFRGNVSGVGVDRFVRDTSGVTTGGTVTNNAQTVRPYYGQSQTVVPPPNFARLPYVGGYVPARPAPTADADLRLGNVADLDAQYGANYADYGGTQTLGPIEDRAPINNLSGPVDAGADPLGLAGDGALDGLAAGGRQRRATALSPYTLLFRGQAGALNDGRLSDYREQLLLGGEEGAEDGADGEPRIPGTEGPIDGSALPSGRVDAAPSDTALGSGAVRSQTLDDVAGSDLSMQPRTSPGRRLPTAAQQSRQYAQLQERFERFNRTPEAAAAGDEAGTYRPGTTITQIPNPSGTVATPEADPDTPGDAADPAAPGVTPPTDAPGMDMAGTDPAAAPSDAGAVPEPGSARPIPPTPLEVTSLGEGVDAPGLKALLDQAEAQIKEGKYSDAVDTYDAAEQVAPNNPLILIGRANAELGASYYRRAEGHLRGAFGADPALLMGQYDLRSMIGEERLNTLVRELRDLAAKDETSSSPLLLLAYIDYNTGNERRAGAYLDTADKRSGGRDPLFAMMQKYWGLSEATESPEAESNK